MRNLSGCLFHFHFLKQRIMTFLFVWKFANRSNATFERIKKCKAVIIVRIKMEFGQSIQPFTRFVVCESQSTQIPSIKGAVWLAWKNIISIEQEILYQDCPKFKVAEPASLKWLCAKASSENPSPVSSLFSQSKFKFENILKVFLFFQSLFS